MSYSISYYVEAGDLFQLFLGIIPHAWAAKEFCDSDSSLTLKVYMAWNFYSLVGKIF